MAVRLGVPEGGAATLARRLAWVVSLRVFLLLVALGAVGIVNVKRGFDSEGERPAWDSADGWLRSTGA